MILKPHQINTAKLTWLMQWSSIVLRRILRQCSFVRDGFAVCHSLRAGSENMKNICVPGARHWGKRQTRTGLEETLEPTESSPFLYSGETEAQRR